MPRFLPSIPSFLRKAAVTSPPPPPAVAAAMVEQGLSYNSPFSPGSPLVPYQGYGGEPRRQNFPTGYNIRSRPGRDGRVSFETLKALIDNYDIARMAIGHRIDDVRSLEYSITTKRGVTGDHEADIEAAYDIMAYPEGPGSTTPFRAWLAMFLEDILRYDAGTLYRRRDRINRVIGLKVVSGVTIAPTLDYWGDTPVPPATAYTQFANGLPWKQYTTDDIIYIPFRPQPDSPYGFAPIESILLTANTDLRFQTYFLNWFREGSIPGGFMTAPADLSSPDQLREYQEYYDALLIGDDAAKHQLKMVAAGTVFDWGPSKEFSADFSEYLMRKVAAAFHVVPADLGFTEDVNKASGDTQADVQFRVGTLPLVQHITDIINAYLQIDRGLPVEFNFDTGQEVEDRLASAQADQIYIQNGVTSISEIREKVYGLSEPEGQTVPRYIFTGRGGPIPLGAFFAVAGTIDPDSGAPMPGAALSHKPFSPVEGVIPNPPPPMPPLAVQTFGDQGAPLPDVVNAVVSPAPLAPSGTQIPAAPGVPVAKEDGGGISAATGIVGHDLIGDDNEDDDLEDAELAKALEAYTAEQASFRRFAKARRRSGSWRDFTFTATAPVEAHRLNQVGRADIRKAAGDVIAAGLCVQAMDSGRVLMLQRGLDPTDAAAGSWEFPGGCLEQDESPFAAACREWQEEVGALLPAEVIADAYAQMQSWGSPNGVYCGFVARVPSEASIDLGSANVLNPDDLDGDITESVAWWDPQMLTGNSAVRAELSQDIDLVLGALGIGDIAKSVGDPRWHDQPVRKVEEKLVVHHADDIRAALAGLSSKDQLKALATAYVASRTDA